jgi:signal transduction histidine kinase/DNA-binding response OmpR family regulator/ligand-binding sensor domain-containing protein
MKFLPLFLFLALFPLFFNGLNGQQLKEGILQFDHLGMQDGLSQSTVLSIHQDKFGWVWLGTRDGLNRYDGYNFQVFRHRVDDPRSISGNTILEIESDSLGNLWIITEVGLSYLDRNSLQFQNFTLPQNLFENSDFQSLQVDPDGRVWVGGRHGLFLFDVEKSEFQAIRYADQSLSLVSALTIDNQQRLWVGTTRFGIYYLKNGQQELSQLSTPLTDQAGSSRIESLIVDSLGIYAGTYGSGLIHLDFNGQILDQLTQATGGLTNDNIRSILKNEDGSVWIGTFDGLSIWNQKGNISQINYAKGNPRGLSHGSIRSLMRDQSGSIWIGTYFGGVNLYNPLNDRFQHFFQIPGNSKSLSYNVIGAFEQLGENEIAIGTERGGINFSDTKGNHRFDDRAQRTIKSLLYSEGTLYVGVFREGLFQVNPDNFDLKKITIRTEKEVWLPDAIINDIKQAENGNFWLATDSDGGLHLVNPRDGKYLDYAGREELQFLIKNHPVKHILPWKGQLLLSTMGKGMIKFDPKSGEIQVIQEFYQREDSLQIPEFFHAFEDRESQLWLSTNGEGVLVTDSSLQVRKRYHLQSGLLNNIALGTMEDSNGAIWVITINGLNQLISGLDDWTTWSFKTGFPLLEINEGAFFQTAKGEFLIGGNNGYCLFDPTRLTRNSLIPKIVFTELQLSNLAIKPGDDSQILSQELNQSSKITLNHQQSVFSIEFAALNYLNSSNNQYQYKLEGFDEDWVQSGTKRSVTYTNLPEGDYTLLVKGSNNEGIWNEDPIELQIEILPPPWRTWWAFFAYALLTILGFITIRKNALRSARLKSDFRIEQLERKRWKEVHDLKLNYFIDVSHEFKTPLTLILNPLEELITKKDQPKWVKDKLKVIYFNSKRLQLLINQILEIRELETGHSKPNYQPLYLAPILEEVVESFKNLADKRKIRLESKFDHLPQIPLKLDQDKLQKILFNLLSNAFKFTKEGGEISLRVNQHESSYHFEVTDTGEGIHSEDLPKVFDRFFKKTQNNFGAGIGLSLTKSLIEIQGGKIAVSSVLGQGSKFEFWLPLEASTSTASKSNPFIKPIPLEFEADVLSQSLDSENEQKIQREEILLFVDDDNNLRAYLKESFRRNYKVITAKNAEKGMEKALKKNPTLIISDVMMPGMSGFELCQKIKTTPETSHIPIILLTAKDSEQHKIEGLVQGADDYISKPFSLIELKARINGIIQNRRLIHQNYREKVLQPSLRESESSQLGIDDQLLIQVNKILQEKLDQPNLTVEHLAEQVHLSRVHFFRKIKSLTGLSPSDLIKNYRISKACLLLENGNYSVADVAFKVGFQDVHYFGKVFKKLKGQSPSSYQESRIDKTNSVK